MCRDRWHRIAVLVAASIVALSVGCKRIETWAEKQNRLVQPPTSATSRPIPVLWGPGLASGRYRIVDVRVEAEPLKRNGKTWDDPAVAVGAEPDLQIEISVDGRPVAKCDGPDDTFVARCRIDVEIALDRATQVSVVVHDRDSVFDDLVGSGTLRDTSRWGVGIDLPLATTSQLRSAVVVLAEVPSWWEIAQPRCITCAIGLAVAIATLVLMRRRRASSSAGSTPSLQPPRRLAVREDPLLMLAVGAVAFAITFDAATLTGMMDRRWGLAIACGWAVASLILLVAQVAQSRRLMAHHLLLFVVIVGAAVLPIGTMLIQAVGMGLFVLGLLYAAFN